MKMSIELNWLLSAWPFKKSLGMDIPRFISSVWVPAKLIIHLDTGSTVHVSNESSGRLNSCNRKFGEHQRRIFRVAWGATKSHSFLVFSSLQMSLKVHCPTNTDSDSQSQIIKKMYYCFATLPKNMAKLSLLLCFHHQHASLDYTCHI